MNDRLFSGRKPGGQANSVTGRKHIIYITDPTGKRIPLKESEVRRDPNTGQWVTAEGEYMQHDGICPNITGHEQPRYVYIGYNGELSNDGKIGCYDCHKRNAWHKFYNMLFGLVYSWPTF